MIHDCQISILFYYPSCNRCFISNYKPIQFGNDNILFIYLRRLPYADIVYSPHTTKEMNKTKRSSTHMCSNTIHLPCCRNKGGFIKIPLGINEGWDRHLLPSWIPYTSGVFIKTKSGNAHHVLKSFMIVDECAWPSRRGLLYVSQKKKPCNWPMTCAKATLARGLFL